MVPHEIAKWISDAIMRRIAPARSEDLLSPEEMEVMAPRMKRFDVVAGLVTFGSAGVLTVALTFGLHWLDLSTWPPTAGIVFDSRWAFPWVGSALMLAFCLSAIPLALLTQRWFGADVQLHHRYEITKRGYDSGRLAWLTFGLCIVWAATVGAIVRSMGQVVDENGILFRPGPLTTLQRRYHEVRMIAVNERAEGSEERGDRWRLRIEFESEPDFELISNKGDRQLAVLERIAAHVRDRSGLPIATERNGG